MIKTFPKDRAANRALLLKAIDGIADTLRSSGPRSEELGTLAPEAVKALRDSGMFRLKLANEMGGAEADPVTEMLVLENLAYHDLSSGWCTMVGATAIASLGTFLTPSGLAKVFTGETIPTASISFFPAGRGVREGDGYRISGRWRFNSGIRHAEWVLGGTIIEGGDAPLVIFAAFPAKDVTLYDNWGGVVGLRGTGSVDFSVENQLVPRDLTFVWDLLAAEARARRAGLSAAALCLRGQGARQRRDRRRTARARRADQDRHHHARHFPLLQARRAAGGASPNRRSRSQAARGARAHA